MTLVVDAGPLIAGAVPREPGHARCIALLQANTELVVPSFVVCEVAYMLERHVGPHAGRAFADSFRKGHLVVEPVEPSDWERVCELVDMYADLPLGIVDASVVATCERLGVTRLATLDHRHFGVVRPRHCEALELLPSISSSNAA